MRKFFAILMAVMLVASMAVPAYAVSIPDIKVNFTLSDSVLAKWFKDHPIKLYFIELLVPNESTEPTESEVTEPAITNLATPVITASKYVHKTPYYGTKRHLEIDWNAVEGAEAYEVSITKADGTTIDYTVTDNFIYDTSAECPKVYIQAKTTWASASVKVRAVAGEVYSEWSEAKKISCDMLH